MSTFGITDSGFALKRLADILNDTVLSLQTVQDPVSLEYLTVDLADENDPMILTVNAISDSISVTWEQLQLAYNQFDPLKATGAGLSGLVQLNNLRRNLGTKATAPFTLTGTPNKAIDSGKQVSDMNDLYMFNLPSFTFDGSGNAEVTGTCTVKGSIVALAGTLVKIVTPVAGWTSAINTDDSSGGNADETDEELRARQQLSTSGTAKSVIDSFYSALAGLPGVTHVRIYQNLTLVTDSRGIPAKTVAVVIVGGDSYDISVKMWQVLALGVGTYGTTATTQTDAQGISYPILFTRPAEVPVYVDVVLEIVSASLWPADGAAKIKAAIIAWAEEGASGLGITTGFDRDGYLPGDTVYASELYTPVNSQLGIRIVSVYVGTSSPALEDEVFIDWNEIATFSSANISISYTEDSSI